MTRITILQVCGVLFVVLAATMVILRLTTSDPTPDLVKTPTVAQSVPETTEEMVPVARMVMPMSVVGVTVVAPAPTSAPTPVSVVRVTPVVVTPSIADLIVDLQSSDGVRAEAAAMQLIEAGAVEDLVGAYISGNQTTKARVVWCLERMAESVRIFSQIRNTPGNWSPEFIFAVEELTGLLYGKFMTPTIPDLLQKKYLLLRLENELKEYRRQLAEMRPEMVQAARNAKLSWSVPSYHWALWSRQVRSVAIRQQYAGECLRLKVQIEETEEIISFLSQEVQNLRREIKEFSKTM